LSLFYQRLSPKPISAPMILLSSWQRAKKLVRRLNWTLPQLRVFEKDAMTLKMP
jgi:hypothetical protein